MEDNKLNNVIEENDNLIEELILKDSNNSESEDISVKENADSNEDIILANEAETVDSKVDDNEVADVSIELSDENINETSIEESLENNDEIALDESEGTDNSIPAKTSESEENESKELKDNSDNEKPLLAEEESDDKDKGVVKLYELIKDNESSINGFKKKAENIKEWLFEHSRLVMPIFLAVCLLLTIGIALFANGKGKLEKEAIKAAENVSAEAANEEVLTTPMVDLEVNAYPEINSLVHDYYVAQANGDIEYVSSKNTYLNDIEKLRIEQLAKYIDSYTEIEIYTKPGMTENTYVAYVCSKVKFKDCDTPMPGMQTFYIGKNDSDEYYINDGTYDQEIYDYIKSVTVQDDVVDLNNKIVVEYNELIANDSELSDFIVYIKGIINEEVGELLAEDEVPADSIETTKTENNGPVATIVSKVKAKESVNIRKSDSKDADRIGTATVGQEFTLIEKKANGWVEVEYNGEHAYINGDYLQDVEEVVVETVGNDGEETNENTADNTTNASTAPSASASPAKDTGNNTVTGKVKVNTSGVRIRKEPNTDSEVLATVYVGEKLEFIEKANDWSKIKYKDMTGYIKSEYLNEVE